MPVVVEPLAFDCKTLLALSVFQPAVEPLQSLLDESVQVATGLVHADAGKLWLYAGDRLQLASHTNVDPRILREFSPRPGEGLPGMCLQQEIPVVSTDVLADDRTARPDIARATNLRGLMAVPLSLGSRSIGVVSVQSSSPRVFGPAEVQALAQYSRRIALVIHHCTYFPDLSSEWIDQLRSDGADLRSPSRAPEPHGVSQSRPRPEARVVFPRSLPKAIHRPTLRLVYNALLEGKSLTCDEASSGTHLSLVTVRRYLTYLVELDLASRQPGYGQRGRPKYLYSLGGKHTPQR